MGVVIPASDHRHNHCCFCLGVAVMLELDLKPELARWMSFFCLNSKAVQVTCMLLIFNIMPHCADNIP